MKSDQALRSPKKKIAGWVHLPRFIDKIRLKNSGKLPIDYQPNFGKGFDGYWLEASGVELNDFVPIVTKCQNDAEIEAWVKANVKKSPEEIEAFNQRVLNRGRNDDASERVKQRKLEAGVGHRDDVQTFVDLIEVDEGRM
jgi:hypothetical protein